MFEVDEAVHAAMGICRGADVQTEIATAGLNAREAVVGRIAERHPDFANVCGQAAASTDEMIEGFGGTGLVKEASMALGFADVMDYLTDVDYLAYMSGMLGFLERIEEPGEGDARAYLRLLELNPEALMGNDAWALTVMGLWFSDAHAFRTRLQRALAG